ncbi:MAG: helix-turn-helix transcriptional regulator [Eubacterium sp.]|nr:helix-turn-helix transcriptional regulator [Eubacterium sp.]
MINVGQRITELRKAKNYTTNKLANLSGISQSYLRDVELGKKNISVEFLSYICESLNISLSDFFNEGDADDEFAKAVFSLNSKQRMALLQFIKSMQ